MVRESVIAQLKEKGLKVTPQRTAIIEVLIERGDLHPSAHLVHRHFLLENNSVTFKKVGAIKTKYLRHSFRAIIRLKSKNAQRSNLIFFLSVQPTLFLE